MFNSILFMIGNAVALFMILLLYKKYQVASDFADNLRYMKEMYWKANINSEIEIDRKRAEYKEMIKDIREMTGKLEGKIKNIITVLSFLLLINVGNIIWKCDELWEVTTFVSLTLLAIQISCLGYSVFQLWSIIKKID